jgi:hypothetical protein
VIARARERVLGRLAEATGELERDAQRGALDVVTAAVGVRQGIIEELRKVDAALGPWSPTERRLLEAVHQEERRALKLLLVRREELLSSFRDLAKGRRALSGYRPTPAATPRLMERRF